MFYLLDVFMCYTFNYVELKFKIYSQFTFDLKYSDVKSI